MQWLQAFVQQTLPPLWWRGRREFLAHLQGALADARLKVEGFRRAGGFDAVAQFLREAPEGGFDVASWPDGEQVVRGLCRLVPLRAQGLHLALWGPARQLGILPEAATAMLDKATAAVERVPSEAQACGLQVLLDVLAGFAAVPPPLGSRFAATYGLLEARQDQGEPLV